MIYETLIPINHKQGGAIQSFNLNREGENRVYDVRQFAVCSVQAFGDASWGTAVLTVSRSNDGAHPVDLETGTTTISGTGGMTDTIDCTGFGYLHVRLTTLEAAADSCTLIVIGKRDA